MVTVQSGETTVLGGLISENSTAGSTGLPFLSSIPILGGLFGTQNSYQRQDGACRADHAPGGQQCRTGKNGFR